MIGRHLPTGITVSAVGMLSAAMIALQGNAVRAQEVASIPSENSVGEPAPSSERLRIRIGRALDFEGRPVFAKRSDFSETAAIATVSTTPFPARRANYTKSMNSSAPLLRGAITSGFGMRAHPIFGRTQMHAGVDLAAPTGSPVLATSDGRVDGAGWGGGYGLTVRLEHTEGFETRYGHLSRLAVVAGQTVRRGDVIGYVGSTGRSTGPHLHYEMRLNGVPIRPLF